MAANEKIRRVDVGALEIILYPDPRLREMATPVDEIDDSVRALVDRMFELMLAARGVGLAAPQVGVTVRLFVACPVLQSGERRVYINPELISSDGTMEVEEGCLSLPGISTKIKRRKSAAIRATDLSGQQFEQSGEDLLSQIFQHECDHLDGKLLVDRMGSVARLAHRRTLKELEASFAAT